MLSLKELIQLEGIFTQNVKEMLQEHSMFDFGDWRMICYLLECFDFDFMKEYLTNSLNDDKNIVRYLDASVTIWTGSGTEYEIIDDYKKYLTKERVLQAIETQKESNDLFLMPEHIQNKCGAFYLYAYGKLNHHCHITQYDIEVLLTTWKE